MRGPISIAVTGIVGLATEAYADHKESKASARAEVSTANASEGLLEQDGIQSNVATNEDNEENWRLDEAQFQLDRFDERGEENRGQNNVEDIVMNFAQQHPPPPYKPTGKGLTLPVVIPQRRPHSKARGFVRAYSPMLIDCGIDEKIFKDFLDGFDSAISKEKLFMVANIAIAAGVLTSTAMMGTNPFVEIAAFLVHSSIEAGRRLYITHKTNQYLYEMNENLFKPHGLYAIIMAYKPESTEVTEVVDLSTNIIRSVASRNDGGGSKTKSASGVTHGEFQMPEAAPLVFPGLQRASEEQKQNAFKKAAAFVDDFADRRAQARFEAENPSSSLNVVPRRDFSSRYADPNHAVNKGGPLCVLTGGLINLSNKGGEKGHNKDDMTGAGAAGGSQSKGVVGKIAKSLQENVLYLMIVNMPSEEELRAVARMDAHRERQHEV